MLQRFRGGLAHRHDPFLVAFADHCDEAAVEVQLFEADIAQFSEAQAAGIGEFEDGVVAQVGWSRLGWRREEFFNFFGAQCFGQALPAARERNAFGGIGCNNFFAFGIAEESAQGGDLEVEALRG